jgi:hypothetical protein
MVLTIEARVAPVIVAIMPSVAIVTSMTVMAFVAAVASVIRTSTAVKLVRFAMPAPMVVFSPLVALTAIVGVGCRRQKWSHQRPREQSGEDNGCSFSHSLSPFVYRLF